MPAAKQVKSLIGGKNQSSIFWGNQTEASQKNKTRNKYLLCIETQKNPQPNTSKLNPARYIKRNIYYGQVGLNPGMQGYLNTQKSINRPYQ